MVLGNIMYSTYDIKKISGDFRTLHTKNLHSFYKSLKCNLQENFVEASAWKTGKKCLMVDGGIELGSCAMTCLVGVKVRIVFIYENVYQYISKQTSLVV